MERPRWADGSLNQASVILAARFGGTPWQWRRETEPDERDIWTALRLLEQEHEQLEEIRREVDDG